MMAHENHSRKLRLFPGRLMRHFQPLRLRVKGASGEVNELSRRPVILAFALMAAGLVVTLVPEHADSAVLGALTGGNGKTYVPALCFLVGDLCLAAGVWASVLAATGRVLERGAVAGLGIVSAALTGQCTRLMWQIFVLRDFYRPGLMFTSAARAAAVGWGGLLAIVLGAGFLAPLLVSAANLLPRALADALPPTRWLVRRRCWLLLPFGALAVTVIITQWVLPGSLAAAMGYSYPTPSGTQASVSLRDLGPAAWTSLQILFALPLLLFMWEGIESARTCQRLVRKPKGKETALLRGARRIDYRLAGAAAIISVALFAVARGSGLSALAGAALLLVTVLSFRGELGRAARLAKSFERGVSRWQLPEEWRDLGRVSLLLAVLAFPVLLVLAGDLASGVKNGIWFLPDMTRFYYYWNDYQIVSIPSVTASAIFGHVDWMTWGIALSLAGIIFFGVLLQGFGKDVRDGFKPVWFLLRVAVFAVALAPVMRMADHSYATLVLAGCAVLAILVTSRSDVRSSAVWSAIIVGGALTLWSLAIWHTTWLPAAALLCLTILQRFAYNAGNLNDPEQYRLNRVAYFQAISLLSVAMLVLGHGAARGYFRSEDLSTVSDHVALSVVAAIWLVMLVARQTPRMPGPEGMTGETGGDGWQEAGPAELPRSWSPLLEPHRELVRFTGREDELTALLAWCEDGQAEALRLVTGPGGTGKTRLALELAARLAGRGWHTLWVPHGEETAAIAAVRAAGHHRVLLVLDNAQTRAGLATMLSPVASGKEQRVRVLLLARYIGPWLNQLTTGPPALRHQVQLARQAQLSLPRSVTTDRPDHTLVAQAVGSIARKFGLRESRAETRFKKTAGRQMILELHAAALVATLTDAGLAELGTGTVQADIRNSGLDQLLSHEQQLWYASARTCGLLGDHEEKETQMLRQIIAACCLLGPASTAEARDLADRIPVVLPSAAVTKWLEDVSSISDSALGPGALLPLGRLAELHTLRELTRSQDLTEACTTRLTRDQALHAITFLAGAVPDYTEAVGLLSQIVPNLTDRIADLASPADMLAAVLTLLPYPCAELAPAAIAGLRQLLDLLPASGKTLDRARWLEHLSLRLAETNDLEGAVAAQQDATILYGELAAADRDLYLPDLAASLVNVSAALTRLGDRRHVLPAAQEAAALYRELAATAPSLFGSPFAQSLTKLGEHYQEEGDLSRALNNAEEAVAIYRELASTNSSQYRPGLAEALTNLGLRFSQQDRHADALPAAEEAVSLYRQLAAADPARYRPRLAGALDRLGYHLSKAGRPADSLPVTQQAIALYRQLTQPNPSRYRDDLTRVQTNLRVRRQMLTDSATPKPSRGRSRGKRSTASGTAGTEEST